MGEGKDSGRGGRAAGYRFSDAHGIWEVDAEGRMVPAGRGPGYGWPGEAREAPPPPPTEPDERQVREMHSTTWQAGEVRQGFTVAGLEEAKGVVRAYHAGSAGSALAGTVREMSGLGAVAFLTFEAGRDDDAFLRRLLGELEAWHAGADAIGKRRFERSFDYDGPGPWHKAGVVVEREGEGLVVRLHRVRSLDCETALAGALGRLPDFQRLEHAFTWRAEGDRFLIPLAFFEALGAALGIDGRRLLGDFADQVIAEAARPDTWEGEAPLRVRGDGVEAVVELTTYRRLGGGELRRLKAAAPGDRRFDFAATGRGFEGPAEPVARFPGWWNAIGVTVHLRPAAGGTEEGCRAAGEALAAGHRHLPPAYRD